MKHMEQFIEDAIKGGWDERRWFEKETHICSALILDPAAWQAVGKMRGWEEYTEATVEGANGFVEFSAPTWRINFLRFIDYLCAGNNFEAALNKIDNGTPKWYA